MIPRRSINILLALAVALATPAVSTASEREGFMRGMVVSCPRIGQVWGSDEMTRTLTDLADLGVDWVSIHPYAGVRRDGSMRIWTASETGYLGRAGEIVRKADMKLFWKPHLAYWGSFEWRGAIEFGDDEAAWQRFFEGYEQFIVDQAAFAQQAGADLFAVGVELEATTHRPEWKRIVQRIRQVFDGRLTYAANWDRLDTVPFWSSLDLIGVHAYFPLSHTDSPSFDEIWRGWDEPLAQLEALSKRHGKPIVFAEIGYNRSVDAARTPWEAEMRDSGKSYELRRRLIDVALERIETVPTIQGMFWWKWIPGDYRYDRDFSMRNDEAREALRQGWGKPTVTRGTAGGF